jgi:hypothetical protein
MPKRTIRIVKRFKDIPLLGICERCKLQFAAELSKLTQPTKAKAQAAIEEQFDTHKCELIDSSQNALRIVRQATGR